MKAISIIRNRGQLTIPDAIRKKAKWADSLSAVSVTLVNPNEIVIQPQKEDIDWDDIWYGIKMARSISGKGQVVSAADFLSKDRLIH
jgi:hypothetical protein